MKNDQGQNPIMEPSSNFLTQSIPICLLNDSCLYLQARLDKNNTIRKDIEEKNVNHPTDYNKSVHL